MKFISIATSFLYNVLIQFFDFLLPILAIFFPKLKELYDGQKMTQELIKHYGNNLISKPVAWFHCASLGEFEQGRPVIEAFRTQFPQYFILLTFFSPSGYRVRKNYNQVDKVMYLPVDTRKNAVKFLKVFKPEVVVFVKYEFWPNFITNIKKTGARLIGISVIFREEQIYFKWYGLFFKNVLENFDHFFLQNKTSGNLLKDLLLENFTISGDTRFDRVRQNALNVTPIEKISNFIQKKNTLVAGSVWPQDLEVIKPFIEAFPQIKIILVPHDIYPEEIKEWKRPLDATLFSEEIDSEKQVLIVDAVGYLSSIYQYADYAYVGGAFGKGLHNILESVVFGIPVFFGNKNYLKFNEAVDLEKLEVAFPIHDSDDFIQKINLILSNETEKQKIKRLAETYISSGTGATHHILNYLKGKK